MRIDVLTLFPEMFENILQESIIGRSIKNNLLDVFITNFRDFSNVKSRQVDDYPYGGGAGMVLKPEPIAKALKFILNGKKIPIIYFTPQGKPLTQSHINKYAQEEHLVFICGHYKEMDQRIRDLYVTDEISVGDYVLSGGELPAMIMIDAIARLQDGVINDIESALTDSFQDGLLGCPHYTRPVNFENVSVPNVLLSGNHKKISQWRHKKSIEITKKRRPDLILDEE